MAFASFRKAAPRRTHHERSQPSSRAKLGFLEKHKDYVERARNFHHKEKRILALQEKARLKNPDEFYFGMQSSKFDNGEFVKKDQDEYGHSITPEMLQLLKSQDLNYIRMLRQIESKQLETARQEIRIDGKPLHHVIYEHSQPIPIESNTSSVDIKAITFLEKKRERLDQFTIMEKKLKNEQLLAKGKCKNVGKDNHGLPVYKWNLRRAS